MLQFFFYLTQLYVFTVFCQLGRLFQMLEGLGTQIEKDGLLDKYRRPENNAVCTEEWSCLTKKVLELLPYTLTSSQLQAVSEIIWDLKRPVPMNRLLQVLILLLLIISISLLFSYSYTIASTSNCFLFHVLSTHKISNAIRRYETNPSSMKHLFN